MRVISFGDGCGFLMQEQKTATTLAMVLDLSGWLEGAAPRLERVPRLGDGEFPAKVQREGRALTLSVLEEFSSRAETVARARAVSAVFRSGEVGHGTITVDDPDLGRISALGVGLDGRPKVLHDERQCRVEWELPLISPDPYLYGDAQRVQVPTPGLGAGLVWPLFHNAAGVQTGDMEWGEERPLAPPVVNLGNATAYPVVTVAGNLGSGFVLDLTTAGRTFGVTYQAAVSPQAPVVVDFAGSVTVNGLDSAWALTRRLWGGVKPGEQATAQLRPVAGGDGTATLELRSTYL